MGRHLGTHFSQILVGLGGQVGWQNGAKIDAKRHRKYGGKISLKILRFRAGDVPKTVPKVASWKAILLEVLEP